MIKKPPNKTPTQMLDTELDASYLLKKWHKNLAGRVVGEVEVRPGEQCRMTLGIFSKKDIPVGFTAYITPETHDQMVVIQIASLVLTEKKYKLILHTTNYGDRIINIEMRQLEK